MVNYIHPRELLVQMLHRLYDCEMTTTSGGNLSIKDVEGNVWITPRGVDKATIAPDDIVMITRHNEANGRHAPSCELPAHRAIYNVRSDVGAVLHAHSPALTAFALVGQIPRADLIVGGAALCGKIALVDYAIPGSEHLAQTVAAAFENGADVVLMANHGVIVVDENLAGAFARVEALDFIARTQLHALTLGKAVSFLRVSPPLDYPEFTPQFASAKECELRADLVAFCARAYRQRLIFCQHSFFAARINEDDFLVTPSGCDPLSLTPAEIVRILNGKRESGKKPARSARLVRDLFNAQKWCGAMAVARPPHATAFSLTQTPIASRAIPESFLTLRNLPLISGEKLLERPQEVIASLTDSQPVVLVENYGLIVTGKNLAEVFDRLETAEFTAQALLLARQLGKPRELTGEQTAEIIEKFQLPEVEN